MNAGKQITMSGPADGSHVPPLASQTAGPSVWHLAASDIRRWARIWYPQKPDRTRLDFCDAVKLIWGFCGLRAALLYRLSHALWKSHIPMLPGMVARRNLTLHGLDIPASVEIGPGLYVPHPVGTVVTASRIGANVSLISSITIGMRDVPEFPVIGDNVFIGAGARVLGGITIGDNVSIGANAVVLMDVPSGATAVGVPARLRFPENEHRH